MQGINCRNVQKYVANHNQQVNKIFENTPHSNLTIQSILGTNSQQIKQNIVYILSAEEVLYYSSQYFIVHNLISKQNTVITREGCINHKTIFIDHFINQNKVDVIFTIQKHNNCLYIGQLEIKGKLTQLNTSNLQQNKNFTWKLNKLTNKSNYSVENMSYHASKNYVYMVSSTMAESKKEKYLWIYDLNKECMIMSSLIKPSISKVTVNRLWVTEQPSQIYLMGHNYFRFWTISFNQKSMKQSNYRNIQRSLYQRQILKLFHCHCQNATVLGVLTETNLLLLKRNELLDVQNPPERLIKKNKNKDNIQLELQNSLNQIYKLKFLFDEDENQRKQAQDFAMTPETAKNLTDEFCCASQIWQGQTGDSIIIATKSGCIMTYSISNGQMKLVHQINAKKSYHFDYATVSKKGEVIILSEKKCQNLYIINKYVLNSEETGEQLRPFWGMGHMNFQNVISIGSPALHQRVCTLGQKQNLKLWSFNGRERKILFEQKLTNQPTKIAMHPSGLLMAINYTKEIKLMSLLPNGIYEIMSAKTNYNSIGLKYSQCGNILVSNQQTLLMCYNPFTLKALGYIQPPELKCKILDFFLTPQGNFIIYHTSDFSLYIHALQLSAYNKYQVLTAAHNQKQAYKCFYFEQGLSYHDPVTKQTKESNFFLGCTQHKYMVLYKNFGKELVAQFPVQDCYIQALSVADGWLFVATSKATIRVYKWPIKQNELQLQIIDLQRKIVKLKHPPYQQFDFWSDKKRITNFHKLGFSNKIVIARDGGSLNILKYNKYIPQRYQETGQRNKLTQIVNDTFYITKNESEKRNRLIEKTEGDILKVEIQISKEKSVLQRKYTEQCRQIQKNFEEKNQLNLQEKLEYLNKLKKENQHLKITICNKQIQYQLNQNKTKETNTGKKQYEVQRNKKIQQSIAQIITSHKRRIETKIGEHKKAISNLKTLYRDKINKMKNQFQQMVAQQYPAIQSKKNVNKKQKKLPQDRKVSIKVQSGNLSEKQFSSLQINQKQIGQLNQKVQQIIQNNERLQNGLEQIKSKVRSAQLQDQNMQKEFQKFLEKYNSSRFTNLSLHSDVLKMRAQFIQRKQIMQNKQQIINAAFQQRQKLQNYKELVKGSLSKLQSRKQQLYNEFIHKQNQVSLVFDELHANLMQLQKLKSQEQRLFEMQKVLEKNRKNQQSKVEESINRLKQLKRFLLLQGLTDDLQHKKMYLERENLLNNVNFYKKRMNMQSMKEKKNKVLKKSALNLVLKQNKNLIEECNQLRQQTIKYDHEIKDLGKKIGDANKMISIESKLKDQKNAVLQQRSQLQAIRALFSDQTTTYKQLEEIKDIDI